MTELEKLKNADTLIRDMTEGRLQIATSIGNNIYVRPKDDAYIGLNMLIRGVYQQNCYKITFDAQVRRMGAPMDATALGKLAQEVQQAQALLTALEMYRFHPTQTDMEQFRDYLMDNQIYGPTTPRQEQVQSAMASQSM
jgi:hypothetical protein